MSRFRNLRRFISADNWDEYVQKDHVTDQRNKLPAPPVQKPYDPDADLIDLVPPDKLTSGTAPIIDVIARRASRRKYTDEALTLEELSFLLWATQGVRKAATKDGGILRTYRTVPSAGARHPLETYIVVNRVEGLDCGLYRYLPVEHKLLLERKEDNLAEKVAHASLEQKFIGRGAVIFVWTAIPYRAEWRYSIVAHKMIAQDSGHLCQNLYLAAEAIDAGACAIAAYYQKPMDNLIGVDGEDEFVIYLSPVGKIG
jgi:SagB-type dehydrogenase family enzyme